MSGVDANKRPTNMVFQSYAIFPHLNVEENVGYGLKKLNLGKDETSSRVNEMLKLVDLENFNKNTTVKVHSNLRWLVNYRSHPPSQ